MRHNHAPPYTPVILLFLHFPPLAVVSRLEKPRGRTPRNQQQRARRQQGKKEVSPRGSVGSTVIWAEPRNPASGPVCDDRCSAFNNIAARRSVGDSIDRGRPTPSKARGAHVLPVVCAVVVYTPTMAAEAEKAQPPLAQQWRREEERERARAEEPPDNESFCSEKQSAL